MTHDIRHGTYIYYQVCCLKLLHVYLSIKHSLCCVEAGARCQPGTLVALVIDVDGVVLAAQPVQISRLHSLCALDGLDMLSTENLRSRCD